MSAHPPLWPVLLPNGWRVDPMLGRENRAEHVRRHFFRSREYWWQISTWTRASIRRESGALQKRPDGGHDRLLDVYESDYEPCLRTTIGDWLDGIGRWAVLPDGERIFVAAHPEGPLVIARGVQVLRVRTAYREPSPGGGHAKADFHANHVRKVRVLTSLSTGPLEWEDRTP